jgi:hypothetical protein
MKKVALSELNEGDQIAEPVINNFGQTLIPANTVITVRYINLLKMWGIDKVFVIDESANSNEKIELSEETRKYIDQQLSRKFQWKPENEWESAIFQLAYSRMVKNLSGKGS